MMIIGSRQHDRVDNYDGRAKTQEFRDRLSKGESFDDIIEEAFAVVREAAWRVLELRHYDVQVLFLLVVHRSSPFVCWGLYPGCSCAFVSCLHRGGANSEDQLLFFGRCALCAYVWACVCGRVFVSRRRSFF